MYACENVYNVVMKEKSIVPKIGNLYAAPLGHGLKEKGVQHEFWGGDVLHVVRASEGYHCGMGAARGNVRPKREIFFFDTVDDDDSAAGED